MNKFFIFFITIFIFKFTNAETIEGINLICYSKVAEEGEFIYPDIIYTDQPIYLTINFEKKVVNYGFLDLNSQDGIKELTGHYNTKPTTVRLNYGKTNKGMGSINRKTLKLDLYPNAEPYFGLFLDNKRKALTFCDLRNELSHNLNLTFLKMQWERRLTILQEGNKF